MSTDNQTKVIHSLPVWLPQTQTWLHNQVLYLPARVQCHIVCERTENLIQFHVPNIHALSQASPLRRLWDRGVRWAGLRRHSGFLSKIAQITNAEILHSHFGNVAWTNLKISTGQELKHVVSFYGQDASYLPQSDPRWYQRYNELFPKVALVLCEGPHMARRLIELGCPKTKVRIHHLGVEVERIPYRSRTWNSKENLKVFIAGAFREKKGIPLALKALGILRRRTPLQITIVGNATSDRRTQIEKERIHSVISNLGLGACTRLPGFLPFGRLLEESYHHHIFLSPSLTASDGDCEGGVPVLLIEMAASGIPIVSTTHCDIPEVIQDGKSGILVKEGNVDELVGRMEWLIEHTGYWNTMARLARIHVEREFNARRQGENLALIYEGLAHEPRVLLR